MSFDQIKKLILSENKKYLTINRNIEPDVINLDEEFVEGVGEVFYLYRKIISTYFDTSCFDASNFKPTLNLNSTYQLPVLIIEDIANPENSKIFLLLSYMETISPSAIRRAPNIPIELGINNQIPTIIDGTYYDNSGVDSRTNEIFRRQKKTSTMYVYDNQEAVMSENLMNFKMYFNGSSDRFIYRCEERRISLPIFLKKFSPVIENIENKIGISYNSQSNQLIIAYKKVNEVSNEVEDLRQTVDGNDDQITFINLLQAEESLKITLDGLKVPTKKLGGNRFKSHYSFDTNTTVSELVLNQEGFYFKKLYKTDSDDFVTNLSLEIKNVGSHMLKIRKNDIPTWLEGKSLRNIYCLQSVTLEKQTYYTFKASHLLFADQDNLDGIDLFVPKDINLLAFNNENNSAEKLFAQSLDQSDWSQEELLRAAAPLKKIVIKSLQKNDGGTLPQHDLLFSMPGNHQAKCYVQTKDIYGARSRLSPFYIAAGE